MNAREKRERSAARAELVKVAVLSGLSNARANGYTKPYDIALSVQTQLYALLDIRLPRSWRLKDFDSAVDRLDRALDREGPDRVAEAQAMVETPTQAAVTKNTRREALVEAAEKLTEEQVAAIHAGLRTLSSYCDGAHSLDGMGFSKIDVRIGHELARAQRLSRLQAALGAKLVRKYLGQLGHTGILEVVFPEAA